MYKFSINSLYSRQDVAEIVGMNPIPTPKTGSTWFTGYSRYNNAIFIFCGVNASGRTGHNYDNHFDGDELIWSGKTGSHQNQPTIQAMISPGAEVHLFWREDNRQKFNYAGLAYPVSVSDSKPVIIRWRFDSSGEAEVNIPEEVIFDISVSPQSITEGAVKKITVNAYERNPVARRACLKAHGFQCAACGFDFEFFYDDIGKKYIHVHHITPISSIGENYIINPVTDLVPLCPNCHAMIHRTNPPMSVEDLKKRIKSCVKES